ncbi:MAG: hypothetical protein ACTS8W_05310 [Arsenophonus sp. NC-PY1-MAG3]
MKRVMEVEVEGKRCGGRSIVEYVKHITEDMSCGSYCQLEMKADKRQEWKDAANQLNGF